MDAPKAEGDFVSLDVRCAKPSLHLLRDEIAGDLSGLDAAANARAVADDAARRQRRDRWPHLHAKAAALRREGVSPN
jgi:hypothetical protein